jgi:hypothetical protein
LMSNVPQSAHPSTLISDTQIGEDSVLNRIISFFPSVDPQASINMLST